MKKQPEGRIPWREGSRVGYLVEAATGCWLWTGAIAWNGYGIVCRPGTSVTVTAHRLIYERKNGAVPKTIDLDHLCRVRRCVNPDHLQQVSRAVNAYRGAWVRRTAEDAERVRALRLTGLKHREIAAATGQPMHFIASVLSDRQWTAERIAEFRDAQERLMAS